MGRTSKEQDGKGTQMQDAFTFHSAWQKQNSLTNVADFAMSELGVWVTSLQMIWEFYSFST